MGMKRILLYFGISMLIVLSAITVNAEEYRFSYSDMGEEAIHKRWDDLISSLPENVRSELDGLSPTEPSGAVNVLRQKTDIRYWLTLVLRTIKSSVVKLFPEVAPIFSLMIIMSALQILSPQGTSVGVRQAFLTYSGLVSAKMLYTQTYSVLLLTQAGLERLCGMMNLMTPVMEAILLSAGSLTQKSIMTQATTLFVTVAGNFTGSLLAPMTNMLFTVATVSSICDEVNFSRFIVSLRKLINRLVQLFTVFFSFMLATQSVLARSADSLGMRTARFVLGSFIPVAGSTIAEALSTLRQGMSLVKNTAGIGGILLIVILLLPDIIQLAVYRSTLGITGTAAELLKLDRFSVLVDQIHGVIELLMALYLFTALMFLFFLILFTMIQVTV